MAGKVCIMEFVSVSSLKLTDNSLENLHGIHFFKLYLLVWASDPTLVFQET